MVYRVIDATDAIKTNKRVSEIEAAGLQKKIMELISKQKKENDEIKEEENKDKDFILDMSEITYISSACLRVLLIAYKQQTAIGGTFSVINTDPNVKNIITSTGFDKFIFKEETNAKQK